MSGDIIIPPRKKPETENEYFEIITKAVFQAGFSWKVVERMWNGFRIFFKNFDPLIVSQMTESDISDGLESPLIVKNERKIVATIENAETFLRIQNEYGSFSNYMGEIRDEGYSYVSKTLQKNFKWIGKTGAYFFLWSVNEDVPNWHDR